MRGIGLKDFRGSGSVLTSRARVPLQFRCCQHRNNPLFPHQDPFSLFRHQPFVFGRRNFSIAIPLKMSLGRTVSLNTGAKIPYVLVVNAHMRISPANRKLHSQLGFGTWQSEPGQVEKAVFHALKTGYRHLVRSMTCTAGITYTNFGAGSC